MFMELTCGTPAVFNSHLYFVTAGCYSNVVEELFVICTWYLSGATTLMYYSSCVQCFYAHVRAHFCVAFCVTFNTDFLPLFSDISVKCQMTNL